MQDDKATMTGDGLTDQYGTDQEIYEIFGEDERLVKTIQDKDNTKMAKRDCWRFTVSCAPASRRR